MKDDIALTFAIDKKEYKIAKKWMKKQKEKLGPEVATIGDRFSYKFTPTGLGVIVSVIDSLANESKILTNFDNW